MNVKTAACLLFHVACPLTALMVTLWGPHADSSPGGSSSFEPRPEAFVAVLSGEREAWASAARRFPGDPWSQDDDYHHAEEDRIRSFSRQHRASVEKVLLSVDAGMRQHWPLPGGDPFAGVAPCRPRPFYD